MVLIAVGPVHSEVRLVHYGTRLLACFSHVCPRLSVSGQELVSLSALGRDLVWIANVLLQLSWCGSSQPCMCRAPSQPIPKHTRACTHAVCALQERERPRDAYELVGGRAQVVGGRCACRVRLCAKGKLALRL